MSSRVHREAKGKKIGSEKVLSESIVIRHSRHFFENKIDPGKFGKSSFRVLHNQSMLNFIK
jgi:hypothetical protein